VDNPVIHKYFLNETIELRNLRENVIS
jgi:hypothetical protein